VKNYRGPKKISRNISDIGQLPNQSKKSILRKNKKYNRNTLKDKTYWQDI
jgi:hypothetical protein